MNLIAVIKYLQEDENNRVKDTNGAGCIYKIEFDKLRNLSNGCWHDSQLSITSTLNFEIYKEEKLYSFIECVEIIKNLEQYEIAIFAYDNENAIAGRGNYIEDKKSNYVVKGIFSSDVKENGINFISELYNTTPKRGKGWEFDLGYGPLVLATDAILGKWRRIK